MDARKVEIKPRQEQPICALYGGLAGQRRQQRPRVIQDLQLRLGRQQGHSAVDALEQDGDVLAAQRRRRRKQLYGRVRVRVVQARFFVQTLLARPLAGLDVVVER